MGIDNAIYIFFHSLNTCDEFCVHCWFFFLLSVKPWARYGYICVLKGHICLFFFLSLPHLLYDLNRLQILILFRDSPVCGFDDVTFFLQFNRLWQYSLSILKLYAIAYMCIVDLWQNQLITVVLYAEISFLFRKKNLSSFVKNNLSCVFLLLYIFFFWWTHLI